MVRRKDNFVSWLRFLPTAKTIADKNHDAYVVLKSPPQTKSLRLWERKPRSEKSMENVVIGTRVTPPPPPPYQTGTKIHGGDDVDGAIS